MCYLTPPVKTQHGTKIDINFNFFINSKHGISYLNWKDVSFSLEPLFPIISAPVTPTLFLKNRVISSLHCRQDIRATTIPSRMISIIRVSEAPGAPKSLITFNSGDSLLAGFIIRIDNGSIDNIESIEYIVSKTLVRLSLTKVLIDNYKLANNALYVSINCEELTTPFNSSTLNLGRCDGSELHIRTNLPEPQFTLYAIQADVITTMNNCTSNEDMDWIRVLNNSEPQALIKFLRF